MGRVPVASEVTRIMRQAPIKHDTNVKCQHLGERLTITPIADGRHAAARGVLLFVASPNSAPAIHHGQRMTAKPGQGRHPRIQSRNERILRLRSLPDFITPAMEFSLRSAPPFRPSAFPLARSN